MSKKRLTFVVNNALKINICQESLLTDVKIKGFMTGLFLAYMNLSDDSKKELRKRIKEYSENNP